MSSTARIAATGSLARLRLCMVMHVARVEGLARGRAHGAASQDCGIGPPGSTGVRKGSVTGHRCRSLTERELLAGTLKRSYFEVLDPLIPS